MFFNVNLFKGMCVCVCVCVCVCMYVCVCVCVWIDSRTFLLSLLRIFLALFISGLAKFLATPFVSSRRFSLFNELFDLLRCLLLLTRTTSTRSKVKFSQGF